MAVQLTVWILFSVVVAVIPVLGNFMLARVEGITVTFELLCSHGELFLASVAIGLSALAEILEAMMNRKGLPIENKAKVFTVFVISASMLTVLIDGLWYGMVSVSLSAMSSYNALNVAWDSLKMLGLTAVSGLGCVAMSSYWVSTRAEKGRHHGSGKDFLNGGIH